MTARKALTLVPAVALLCGAGAMLILYREAAAGGVYTGIYTCLNTLIPSLFPFIVLACAVSRSSAADCLFRPLAPLLRHAFHLPPSAAPALLLGLTAGYPTGAKIAAQLLSRGALTRNEAARLLCFCTAPGYAFAASYTGAVMLGRPHAGLLLFLSTALAPLLLGAALARFSPLPENTAAPRAVGDFPHAVRDAVSATVSMCAYVVLFSALLAVLRGAGILQGAANLLAHLGFSVPGAGAALTFSLEVTAGVAHGAYWHLSPMLMAFGLGFGGLCIHLQIFSFFSDTGFPLKKTLYLLTRAATGFLSALCYRVLSLVLPEAESAAVSGVSLPRTASGSAAGSLALLALSLFFLLFCADTERKGWKFPRRNATIEKKNR